MKRVFKVSNVWTNETYLLFKLRSLQVRFIVGRKPSQTWLNSQISESETTQNTIKVVLDFCLWNSRVARRFIPCALYEKKVRHKVNFTFFHIQINSQSTTKIDSFLFTINKQPEIGEKGKILSCGICVKKPENSHVYCGLHSLLGVDCFQFDTILMLRLSAESNKAKSEMSFWKGKFPL